MFNNQWCKVSEPHTDFTSGKCVVKIESWPTEIDMQSETNSLPIAMCLFQFTIWDFDSITIMAVAEYANWQPYNEDLIETLLLPTILFNLNTAIAEKAKELAYARVRTNVTSFTYNNKEYSATQTAQNDLNAIANYASLFNTLPSSFPNAWQAIDGTVISIADVAAFKDLYSAMVSQGSSNFIKLQTLLYQASIATTQADIDLIVW